MAFSFSFLWLAYLLKLKTGTWMTLAGLFNILWFCYSFFPLLIAFDESISFAGVLYIFIFNALFSMSVFIFNWERVRLSNFTGAVYTRKYSNELFYTLSLVCVSCVIVGTFIQSNLTYQDLISSPIKFAGKYAELNYSENMELGALSRIGLVLSYIVVAFGGLIYGSTKDAKILGVSFFPSLLILIMQSQKGLIFFSMMMFAGAVCVVKIQRRDFKVNFYYLYATLIRASIVIVPLIFVSFLARGLSNENDTSIILDRIIEYSVSYSSGHLYAFSHWLDEFITSNGFFSLSYGPSYGLYTFTAFFKIFGLQGDIPAGIYADYFYGDIVTTNIYTIYRGIITDFSLLGSFVFAAFSGLVINGLNYKFMYRPNNPFLISFYIFAFGFIYQTFVVSSLTWVTIPFVYFVLSFFLFRVKF